MIRIYRDFDRFNVYNIKQLLEDNNIPCHLKNEYVAGAIGEVSPLDAQPEVWLIDAEWENRAQQLIDEYLNDKVAKQGLSEWQCTHCGEMNDPSFDICWQCHKPSALS